LKKGYLILICALFVVLWHSAASSNRNLFKQKLYYETAAGAGGFLAGAMSGYAAAAPLQSLGNHIRFGDPLMTAEQFIQGICFSAITGGTINGVTAWVNGRSFMTGTLPAPQPQSVLPPIIRPKTELKTDAIKPKIQPLNEGVQRSEVSPKVQKTLDAIKEVKADGGVVHPHKLKSTQELNLSIEHNDQTIRIRVESHPLPVDYGGAGGNGVAIRHLNIELLPPPIPPLPNNGHIILPPLK
jgi:hypothetical protein